MFYDCSNFTGVGLVNWTINTTSTSSVNMLNMFYGCTNASFDPNLSTWNVSTVTNFNGMFYDCSNFTGDGLDNWTINTTSTSSVHMLNMFYGCSNASFDPNLSTWNVSTVTDFSNMFRGCSNFTGVGLDNWTINTTSTGVNMSAMFQDCSTFDGITITTWNTSNVTDMRAMFMFSSSINVELITSGDKWDTSNVKYFSNMFRGCTSFKGGGIPTWDVQNGANFFNMLDGTGLDEEYDLIGWRSGGSNFNATLNKDLGDSVFTNILPIIVTNYWDSDDETTDEVLGSSSFARPGSGISSYLNQHIPGTSVKPTKNSVLTIFQMFHK